MKEPKEISFEFEETSLQEAQVLANNKGKYGALVLTLLEKLPAIEQFNLGKPIEQCKTPKFSIPGNHTLDQKEIKGLVMGVNSSLHKQGMEWKVRYIEQAKAFVCIPKEARKLNRNHHSQSLRSRVATVNSEENREKVMALKAKGMKGRQIAETLGWKEGKVNGYLYPKSRKKAERS